MNRKGASLLEMIIVMSLTSVVLVIGGQVIHTLLRSERNGAMSLVESLSRSRLNRDFRRDVRAAQALSPTAGDDGQRAVCELQLEHNRRVIYRQTDRETLARIELFNGTVHSRDDYAVAPGKATVESTGETPLVVLTHRFRPAAPSGAAAPTGAEHEIRIVAALGRDHRFQRALIRKESAE